MPNKRKVEVPDIGDFKDVDVIEVLVKPGDTIDEEQSLITIESEKATMEIPSPAAGTVKSIAVSIGDKVSEGSEILTLEEAEAPSQGAGEAEPESAASKQPASAHTGEEQRQPAGSEQIPATREGEREQASGSAQSTAEPGSGGSQTPSGANAPPAAPQTAETVRGSATSRAHASPSVRRFARELGVDLGLVTGSGPKGRILKEDVQAFVKGVFSGAAGPGAVTLPESAPVDFSKFGEVERRALGKIRRLAGQNLHRSWITVPHVTQFDEADITELEDFRREHAKRRDEGEDTVKLTLLSFLLKAAVVALRKYPEFNVSLAPGGGEIIVKHYFHIGVAVDTAEGLVVPVIRDVDQKGLFQLAAELQEVAEKARNRKLTPGEMQGGCFSISSLGGIGGTAFTPIINAPEVAILGVSRTQTRAVYKDGKFVPRLILPFALSYDHRVIDGAAAARFTTFLGSVLSDIRQLLL